MSGELDALGDALSKQRIPKMWEVRPCITHTLFVSTLRSPPSCLLHFAFHFSGGRVSVAEAAGSVDDGPHRAPALHSVVDPTPTHVVLDFRLVLSSGVLDRYSAGAHGRLLAVSAPNDHGFLMFD